MHDQTPHILARVDRLVAEWLTPALVRERRQLGIEAWQVPDEPVPFPEARHASYEPFESGTAWGRPWSTTWFHVTGEVPGEWADSGLRAEIDVDLGFTAQMPGFQAEGAAWNPDGVLVKGISPRNAWVPLAQGSRVDLYIEAAANPDVPGAHWTRPSPYGSKETAPSDPLYTLRHIDVVLRDPTVEALVADVAALRGLVDTLPETGSRRARIVAALEDMCDAVDPDDVPASAAEARQALADVLAAPAHASAHTIHAVGHAHIDSAWLWPVRETTRKVARTVANVLALMDTDDDVSYAFSSAQQYAWIERQHPELFERLRERVAEGRIVPVGGMWVESDTNMVGSEALVRQFVEGKTYFRERFGVDPQEVWLPDSFGYTASFPQVAQLAGCPNFLTQKLSWSDTNRIPHHTFWWEGIDGTRVFTHFPPIDTYCATLNARELAHAEEEFRDKARASHSLAPFGYGDGGGGPTREMVQQARRVADLEGSPRVRLSSPGEFFTTARTEYAGAAPTWVGELYLEFHRGTYTSQARTKAGNRRSEHLLREAELWAATATVRTGAPYPAEQLRMLWQRVLLLQFHDILPGTSIAWVHREAERDYEVIEQELETLIEKSLRSLGVGQNAVANASPFERDGVPALAAGVPAGAPSPVVEGGDNGWVLRNGALQVRVDRRGLVTSAVANDREFIPHQMPGNLLQFHRDIPNNWEAWDIDRHYRRVVSDLVDADDITVADNQIRIWRHVGKSWVRQTLWLADGDEPTLHVRTEVDWHEQQKLLKLAFPVNVLADRAASQMQFGHVVRPLHANTSWDAARYETVAHRWVHVGDGMHAVALANDRSYGHDITRARRPGAPETEPPCTVLRASLVRAPLFPDPDADQGLHVFHHAIRFGASIQQANELGYALNLPRRHGVAEDGNSAVAPLVSVSNPQVVIEAIKLAHDGSGDIVVRLYESLGQPARTRLRFGAAVGQVTCTDLLEQDTSQPLMLNDGVVNLELRAFQIVTLRARRA